MTVHVAGLILAAGLSTRFGGNKLIEPISDEPLIRKTMGAWLNANITKLYVVIGHRSHEIMEALEGLPLDVIENPRFETGLASSVVAGIQHLQGEYDRILIGLGDMPYVMPETLNTLIDAAALGGPNRQIWIPQYDGQRGNPVLWGRSAFSDLSALTGDQGGRQLFQKYETVIEDVCVEDPGILRDIDLRQDLQE